MPGAGKTKLTCMVIDYLASRCTYEPVVYFYCNRNESQRRTPEVVMRAIIKQLSVVLPGDDRLPEVILQEYKGREKGGLADGALRLSECEKLIVSLLDIHPQTTIIIDALDEVYQDKRWILISSLQKIIVRSPSLVKIFVSSRDNLDIRLRLEDVPNMYIEATDNRGDITRYIQRELKRATDNRLLLAGRASESLKAQIISTIEQHANGMFQWVDLQIKQLYHLRFEDEIMERLGKMPKTLKETYFEIWHEICEDTPRMQELTKRALMWVMCSVKQLSKSLWVQLSYRNTKIESQHFDNLLDLCRNLVAWDKQLNKAIFSHLSVQEFLEDNIFTEPEAHAMAAYTCISYLSTYEFHKSWLGAYEQNAESPEDKERNIYVRSFWPDHVDRSFDEANPIDPSLQTLLNHFLSPGSDYETRSYPRAGDTVPYPNEWMSVMRDGSFRSALLENVRNPLFVMSFFLFGEEMESLWKTKAFDVNMKNLRGLSLLDGVCTRRSRWILDFLLQRGADVHHSQMGNYNHTSLYLAVKYTQPEAIIKLLENGATPSIGTGCNTGVNIEHHPGTYAHILRDPVQHPGNTGVNILHDLVRHAGNELGNLKRVLSWNRSIFRRNKEITRCRKQGNKAKDKEQVRYPLNICGYFRMTKNVLIWAMEWKRNVRDIFEIIFSHYPRLKINTRFLILVVERGSWEREMIELLFDCEASLKVTESALVAVATGKKGRAGSVRDLETIKFLIDRDSSLVVTEPVLVAAAANEQEGRNLMRFLIDRNAGLEITERVLVAAAKNWLQGLDIIQFLINRNAGLEVTEAVLVAAAKNWLQALEIIQFLINRNADLEVTEAVLVAAAINIWDGLEMIKFLIDRDSSLVVTEPVLVAAAANEVGGLDIIQFLINRNADLEFTEAVLVAAAANEGEGVNIIKFLVNRNAGLDITEAVLVAAAGNRHCHELLQFLLKHDPAAQVTESVLAGAVTVLRNTRILEFIFNRQPSLNPTQSTLVAALSDRSSSLAILNLLFDRDPGLKVTEPVMVAAASKEHSIDLLLAFFRHDPTLKVSEATLLAIASNEDGDDITEFLFNYGAVSEFSKAVILVAAEVWCGYHTLPMFMLLQHCEDLEFTESELKMLRSSPYKETIEEFLQGGEDGCNLGY